MCSPFRERGYMEKICGCEKAGKTAKKGKVTVLAPMARAQPDQDTAEEWFPLQALPRGRIYTCSLAMPPAKADCFMPPNHLDLLRTEIF